MSVLNCENLVASCYLRVTYSWEFIHLWVQLFNPLSVNPTKWSKTLKHFVSNLPTNCLSWFDLFMGLALKGLTRGFFRVSKIVPVDITWESIFFAWVKVILIWVISGCHSFCVGLKNLIMGYTWIDIFSNELIMVYRILHKLHKKWSFPLRTSSVNVTKSAVFCRFGHSYWRNP